MSSETVFPDSGRLAGIDNGEKRIGVAVCDAEWRIASPLVNYARAGQPQDADFFRRLAAKEQIAGFIVGLPLYPSGDESPKSAEARQFGGWLAEATGLPVRYFDERYTTELAEEALGGASLSSKKRKARRDKVAAQIILAGWLDAAGRESRAS